MHVLLIVLGLLLMLFGGGCMLLAGVTFMGDPHSMMGELGTILPIWLAAGLAPLVVGFLMFRAGLRKDREKRMKPPKET